MFRRIATYSASLYGVTLVSSAVSFAVTMIVAKRISREALGLYGFYVTVYSFIGMLICSGINQALVKRLGEARDESPLVRFSLSLSALLAVVCWPAALLLHGAGSVGVAFAIAALPFFTLQLLAASVFRSGFEKKKEVTLRVGVSLVNSIVTLSLVFLAVNPERAPIIGDFTALALPGLVIAVLLARSSGWRPGRPFGGVRTPEARDLLRFAVPLTIAGIAFFVYMNASSLLIRALVGLAALGEYYFALQLLQILDKPMMILASVVLSAFAREPEVTPEKHRRLVAFNLAVFPTIAACVALASPLILRGADIVLGGVGGDLLAEKYPNAPVFVALFALAVPARCIEFLVSTLAIARGRPEVNRNTHVVTTAIALPVLAVLVWQFGAWGAAVMPLFYQAVFLTTQRQQLRESMPDIVLPATRSAVIATFLLAALLGVGFLVPGAMWLFPLGALLYLALGHALGAFDLWTLLSPLRGGPLLRSSRAR